MGINGLIFSDLCVVKMVFLGCFRKSGVKIFREWLVAWSVFGMLGAFWDGFPWVICYLVGGWW